MLARHTYVNVSKFITSRKTVTFTTRTHLDRLKAIDLLVEAGLPEVMTGV